MAPQGKLPGALDSADVRDIAATFGLDPEQAEPAIAALADAMGWRLQRTMLSRGGVANVVDLLARGPRAMDDGTAILDLLVGSKHASRGIAQQVASSTGVDVETAKRMLPVVADRMFTELQRKSKPQFDALARKVPEISTAMSRSPLPLPGDLPRQTGRINGKPSSGTPLPIPPDDIPGTEPDAGGGSGPFDQLPDIIRRGGVRVPNGGGSLEGIIRSIVASVLGTRDRGIIGTMIQLFLVRFLAGLARRVLGRIFTGR